MGLLQSMHGMRVGLSVIALAILGACGGGGGGSGSSSAERVNAQVGVLGAIPVEGISYSTPSLGQKTRKKRKASDKFIVQRRKKRRS